LSHIELRARADRSYDLHHTEARPPALVGHADPLRAPKRRVAGE
jgi:hypothetical protein